jgi:hypothetical protein
MRSKFTVAAETGAMEDKFTRYTKLYILIFLMFLSIPVLIGLLIALFYGVSKIVSSGPVDIAFEILVISIPAAIFSSAYIIFFKRTRLHPKAAVRIISMLLFVAGLICCLVLLVMDIHTYFTTRGVNITDFRSFNVFFLSGNIGGLFLVAIMQAFTTQKEKDWLEKRKGRDVSSLN